MSAIIGFIIVLIPLVVVHEFGHFLFAKWFNVRADAFSIGFGPVIFQRKIGETDFRVSAIPLGGYVKLLGEDPTTELSPEEKKRALHFQAPWKRFFIFFGGPLFNFIWAIIVFMGMMALGETFVSTKIGRVLPDSKAAKIGIVSGDRITSIDGVQVKKFEEFNLNIADKGEQDVRLTLERNGLSRELVVRTEMEDGFSIYGEQKKVGAINGLFANPRTGLVGISNPETPAARTGIQTGDEIIAINGKKVENFEQLEEEYASWKIRSDLTTKSPVKFQIKNAAGEREVNLSYAKGYSGSLSEDFGIHSAELFIEQTVENSPAAKSGILKGDRMVAVNQVPMKSFYQLRMAIQASGEENGKVQISLERLGKKIDLEITPQVSTERDPMLKKLQQYTIGVMPMMTLATPEMIEEQFSNPITLIYKGTIRMFDLTAKNFISIAKMIQGKISVKTLGGPILIGKIAGDSMSRGLIDFLRTMAILSIGLGVLNILPIPVLDGGHIVLLGLEVVRGKALSLKQMELAQQVGLFFILGLMIVVMKNDISRLPIFN